MSDIRAERDELQARINRALRALAMDVRSSVRCAAAREELLGYDPLDAASFVAGGEL